MPIRTARLELVPGTEALVRAEIEARAEFALQLGASVPASWPPESVRNAGPLFLDQLESHPDQVGWWCWYALAPRPSSQERDLVGGGGFKGPPEDGSAEIGYSVLPEFRCRGYGTEIVRGLVEWALSHAEVFRVTAETEWANPASVRVLHKAGFTECGKETESGGARFACAKGDPDG